MGSPAAWCAAITFPDYLRRHSEVAHAYAGLKRWLTEQFPADSAAFVAAKTAFVRHVLQLADHP